MSLEYMGLHPRFREYTKSEHLIDSKDASDSLIFTLSSNLDDNDVIGRIDLLHPDINPNKLKIPIKSLRTFIKDNILICSDIPIPGQTKQTKQHVINTGTFSFEINIDENFFSKRIKDDKGQLITIRNFFSRLPNYRMDPVGRKIRAPSIIKVGPNRIKIAFPSSPYIKFDLTNIAKFCPGIFNNVISSSINMSNTVSVSGRILIKINDAKLTFSVEDCDNQQGFDFDLPLFVNSYDPTPNESDPDDSINLNFKFIPISSYDAPLICEWNPADINNLNFEVDPLSAFDTVLNELTAFYEDDLTVFNGNLDIVETIKIDGIDGKNNNDPLKRVNLSVDFWKITSILEKLILDRIEEISSYSSETLCKNITNNFKDYYCTSDGKGKVYLIGLQGEYLLTTDNCILDFINIPTLTPSFIISNTKLFLDSTAFNTNHTSNK